jgi:5-methyltetrahydropteroyltriglutamate--homocysteine methyltransferase
MNELSTIRNDVVGSLLRPAKLKEIRLLYDEGKAGADELRAAQDDAVRQVVALQEKAGLDVVTDGEFRRLNFQDSFGASVSGFRAGRADWKSVAALAEGGKPLQRWEMPPELEKGAAVLTHRRSVVERLRLVHHGPLEEFRFVSSVAKKPAKVTLIGPDRISQRFDYENSTSVYSGMDEFLADVVRIEREMMGALVEAGCRYIQIDAPGYTAYVDTPSLEAMRQRGEDPMVNLSRSIRADNELIGGFESVTFGIHLCRGNQRSMWHREGSYDAIAERLFAELNHDRFLLEYDSPRAGGFEPLRHVPKGKVVVLGLVSTKVPAIETVEALKRRIDEAGKYLPLEQLAISPQCGFASDVAGNLISESDEKRKLEVVVETARQVWG